MLRPPALQPASLAHRVLSAGLTDCDSRLLVVREPPQQRPGAGEPARPREISRSHEQLGSKQALKALARRGLRLAGRTYRLLVPKDAGRHGKERVFWYAVASEAPGDGWLGGSCADAMACLADFGAVASLPKRVARMGHALSATAPVLEGCRLLGPFPPDGVPPAGSLQPGDVVVVDFPDIEATLPDGSLATDPARGSVP